jgi:hypothetical protein
VPEYFKASTLFEVLLNQSLFNGFGVCLANEVLQRLYFHFSKFNAPNRTVRHVQVNFKIRACVFSETLNLGTRTFKFWFLIDFKIDQILGTAVVRINYARQTYNCAVCNVAQMGLTLSSVSVV